MAKYNIRTAKNICNYIEEGLSQKDSAMLAGISEDTFYAWRKEKSEFSESLERAVVLYKQKLLSKINSYTFKDGRLALEVLSRRWPSEFGKKDNLPAPKEEPNKEAMTEETAKAVLKMLEANKKRVEPNQNPTLEINNNS